MLERTGKHRRITFVVRVNTLPGRPMRWYFETSNGLTGEGVTGFGIEAAFKNGADAATAAIDFTFHLPD